MITDNTGKAISLAKDKIKEAESLLCSGSEDVRRHIHWYASPKLSVMDKRGMLVPNLDFSENMQLIVRFDGGKWVTFIECMANKMSGRDFKKKITEFAHQHGYKMVEVKELFTDDGKMTETLIDIIE